MDDITKQLWQKLRSNGVDINNLELFIPTVMKGFIYKLNKNLKLRDIYIPHFIINTGDDIMYLEPKGQKQSIEPLENSNENFVYNQIPRCMVQPTGVNLPTDQLTSPYSYGTFQVECNDMVYAFRGEFRRMPMTMSFSLKYYFDSLTDAFEVAQQIIANLSFINNFSVVYLGQRIHCSYKIPEEFNTEFMIEFDGITTDNKARTLSLELEVLTNFPIIYPETVIPADAYIKEFAFAPAILPMGGINTDKDHELDPINTGSMGGLIDGIEGPEPPDDGLIDPAGAWKHTQPEYTDKHSVEIELGPGEKSGEFASSITLFPKGGIDPNK